MVEDADRLVARAIESVLDQVPGALDTAVPDVASAKLQPWAETAAPVGRNKRPLEELLAELEERVAAAPDARATLPHTRHPSLAFFDRFGRIGGQPAGGEPGRHRRRRRGGGGEPVKLVESAASASAGVPAGPSPNRPPGGRRRSRRGRGGGGSAQGGGPPRQQETSGGAPRQDGSQPPGQPRAPGSGGRRRRGRRGRGGDRQPPA